MWPVFVIQYCKIEFFVAEWSGLVTILNYCKFRKNLQPKMFLDPVIQLWSFSYNYVFILRLSWHLQIKIHGFCYTYWIFQTKSFKRIFSVLKKIQEITKKHCSEDIFNCAVHHNLFVLHCLGPMKPQCS